MSGLSVQHLHRPLGPSVTRRTHIPRSGKKNGNAHNCAPRNAAKGGPVIEAQALNKVFGDPKSDKAVRAVQDVTFNVKPGEIFAFLGPNGAGKTTTIQMLTTLLKPTSGSVRIDGLDPTKSPLEVRKRFGIVFQDPSLDSELTAYENMELHGVLYHVPRKVRAERREALLNLFELWARRAAKVTTVSGGLRRSP